MSNLKSEWATYEPVNCFICNVIHEPDPLYYRAIALGRDGIWHCYKVEDDFKATLVYSNPNPEGQSNDMVNAESRVRDLLPITR